MRISDGSSDVCSSDLGDGRLTGARINTDPVAFNRLPRRIVDRRRLAFGEQSSMLCAQGGHNHVENRQTGDRAGREQAGFGNGGHVTILPLAEKTVGDGKIGRASSRERGGQYGYSPGCDEYSKKKKYHTSKQMKAN